MVNIDVTQPTVIKMIDETGIWQAYRKGDTVYIATTSSYDTTMTITGDFYSEEEKYVYAQEIAHRLNVWAMNNEVATI